LGLRWDEEANLGGADPDTASVAISVISTPYTGPLPVESVNGTATQEHTIQQWIGTNHDIQQSPKYIKSALQIALKLTQFLIGDDAMPLGNIAANNVRITTRRGKEGGESGGGSKEAVELAWIMSSMGQRSAVGTVSARLFAFYMNYSLEKSRPWRI
jgi:hypothetical protein